MRANVPICVLIHQTIPLLTMKNEMDYELVLGPLAAKTFSSRTSLGCPKNRTRAQTSLQRLWEMIPFCKGDRENDRIS